ncbi:hypothetical protein SPOG_00092 [Schizosaccharomyces cryophilus OY26]|uniref:Uncharacterized protein n=1 Tax=Schizosaccharomyces cryophilus (strain OY26 / ATCC MYA-4695 / CBS 11777 / NBRC 106824 / NRRL Y48691) TaxID=653667 RepID=S9X3I4_SCHCR|nr:uncharacterized protein SPOG_00092 [Schizosaccharomyces cryophilus OY26]EPY51667.1 hypothetical protein SPOG_00092 [Schizosaccharomyces cryophilus OY26]
MFHARCRVYHSNIRLHRHFSRFHCVLYSHPYTTISSRSFAYTPWNYRSQTQNQTLVSNKVRHGQNASTVADSSSRSNQVSKKSNRAFISKRSNALKEKNPESRSLRQVIFNSLSFCNLQHTRKLLIVASDRNKAYLRPHDPPNKTARILSLYDKYMYRRSRNLYDIFQGKEDLLTIVWFQTLLYPLLTSTYEIKAYVNTVTQDATLPDYFRDRSFEAIFFSSLFDHFLTTNEFYLAIYYYLIVRKNPQMTFQLLRQLKNLALPEDNLIKSVFLEWSLQTGRFGIAYQIFREESLSVYYPCKTFLNVLKMYGTPEMFDYAVAQEMKVTKTEKSSKNLKLANKIDAYFWLSNPLL